MSNTDSSLVFVKLCLPVIESVSHMRHMMSMLMCCASCIKLYWSNIAFSFICMVRLGLTKWWRIWEIIYSMLLWS